LATGPGKEGGEGLNIAWVTYGLPWPMDRGAALRDAHLLRYVTQRHHVHLFAVLEKAPGSEAMHAANTMCASVDWVLMRQEKGWQKVRAWAQHALAGHPLATWSYCPGELAQRLSVLVRRERIDVVQIEHSFLAPFVGALAHSPCRTILDLHNYGATQYQSMLRMPCEPWQRLSWLAKAALMSGWEGRIARRFDRCLAVSPLEAQALASAAGRPVDVLPNGVDTETLPPLAPSPGNKLLFVGNLRYRPNDDAVDWMVRDILPRVREEIEDAELMVVGARQGRCDRSEQGVRFLGMVDDLVTCYRGAQLALAPLRAGGGTRLKILEAMALGRPVVSTTLGCEGLPVVPGEHLLTADSPQTFAAAIVRLLRDRRLCEQIAGRARSLVERELGWAKIGGQLLSLYDRLSRARASRRSHTSCNF
jgi:polysaccharide biosynthesis protein PslH